MHSGAPYNEDRAMRVLLCAFDKLSHDFGVHMHIRGGLPKPEKYWGAAFWRELKNVLDNARDINDPEDTTPAELMARFAKEDAR